jgi:hypothetical protein
MGHPVVLVIGGLVLASVGGAVARLGLEDRIDARVEASGLGRRLGALERQLDTVNRVADSRAALQVKVTGADDFETRLDFLERQVAAAVRKAERANQRLNEARLAGDEAVTGEAYGCGGREVRDIPYVMVGLRDGAGCGSQNLHYYRKLTLAIPRE